MESSDFSTADSSVFLYACLEGCMGYFSKRQNMVDRKPPLQTKSQEEPEDLKCIVTESERSEMEMAERVRELELAIEQKEKERVAEEFVRLGAKLQYLEAQAIEKRRLLLEAEAAVAERERMLLEVEALKRQQERLCLEAADTERKRFAAEAFDQLTQLDAKLLSLEAMRVDRERMRRRAEDSAESVEELRHQAKATLLNARDDGRLNEAIAEIKADLYFARADRLLMEAETELNNANAEECKFLGEFLAEEAEREEEAEEAEVRETEEVVAKAEQAERRVGRFETEATEKEWKEGEVNAQGVDYEEHFEGTAPFEKDEKDEMGSCPHQTTEITGSSAVCQEEEPKPEIVTRSSPAPKFWPEGLNMFHLHVEQENFDPASTGASEILLKELDASPDSVLTPLSGFAGGLNEGIWFLSEPSGTREDLVLKLVRGTRKYPEFPTEAENLLELYEKYPSIVKDRSVSFPFQIGKIFTPSMEKYDILVMRKASGQSFADHITTKSCLGQMDLLQDIMAKIGARLNQFHHNYGGQQHGDFQPSNIFYDERADVVTIIDVGGIGIPTVETDADHFEKSMRACYSGYGPDLMVKGMARFIEALKIPLRS